MCRDDDLIRRLHALTAPLTSEPTGLPARTEPLSGIRAVLFDVYGTLVISGCGDIGVGAQATADDPFRAALAAAGLELPAVLPADFGDGRSALTREIRASHARSRAEGIEYPEVEIREIWRALLAGLGLDPDDATLCRIALEYELRSNPVWPMPGLASTLAALRARGLVLGIVSNAQFYTPLMLRAFLGAPLEDVGFDPRCAAWSYRLRQGKPSPAVYRQALQALQIHHRIPPEAVLYIGNDQRNDIWPARNLGCRTALFAGDARSLRLRSDDPVAAAATPDRIITRLAQIPDALLPVAPV
jgi:putative hydrolase of the HAD superfamily